MDERIGRQPYLETNRDIFVVKIGSAVFYKLYLGILDPIKDREVEDHLNDVRTAVLLPRGKTGTSWQVGLLRGTARD